MTRTYILRAIILIGIILIFVDIISFIQQGTTPTIYDYFRMIDWAGFGYSLYQVFHISRYRLLDEAMTKLTIRNIFYTVIFFLFIFSFKSFIIPAGVFVGHILILRNELNALR